jgi:glycosyltransferase involved in cell wall biosynthesis
MASLTVFTPAYNRAHTIGRTYESLCRQTCKDFEWLVVDDGSSDNTRELIEGWIAEGKIPIRYIYQQNQGMHGAHNTAYRSINTPLNTCIDSDDYMPDDAVEKILTCWREHGSDKFAGLVGLDVFEGGKVIGTKFPDDMMTTTLQGFYASGGRGDKKLVYRTDVINRYPEYPLFEGERYVGLAYKYMLIDQDYELITLNEPLVVVEYQQDGSSYNMYKQYWNNPKGAAFYRKAEMRTTHSLKRKLMVCTHYVSSSIISRNKHFIQESPEKFLTILCIPAGIALYYLIRYKVSKGSKMNINH